MISPRRKALACGGVRPTPHDNATPWSAHVQWGLVLAANDDRSSTCRSGLGDAIAAKSDFKWMETQSAQAFAIVRFVENRLDRLLISSLYGALKTWLLRARPRAGYILQITETSARRAGHHSSVLWMEQTRSKVAQVH